MRLLRLLIVCLVAAVAQTPAVAAEPTAAYAEFAEEKSSTPGFFELLIDQTQGRVFLVVPREAPQFLLQVDLARGIGSNDVGLDRGQLGDTQLVSFERVGTKVLLRAHNTRFRASADNPAERQAAEEAFATSVLWGFTVVAEDAGRYVIDYTDFLISDSYRIGEALQAGKHGKFAVDPQRSAPFLPLTRSFPDNTELEATVTLTGSDADEAIRSVAPDATALTVHVHHSLVRLPDDGFQPRQFHPGSGYFPITYLDYSAPLDADMVRRVIPRHRLSGDAAIVYYLDPGVPEPIRSALLDGARWWTEAFAAAGHADGFRVELLPAGVDPMDVRYNVIQWVHRSTRGWSYGLSVVDPRTGEILKGKVTLGSLRIRQDLLIAQGLLAPFSEGVEDNAAEDVLQRMALARIRQLAAHEVGHTLGLAHNYSASADGRASVMDYPHPLLQIRDGAIDLADAYAEGMGAWDLQAIRYGYEAYEGSESDFIEAQLARTAEQGLSFVTDRDARAPGGAHPRAHLWDSGADAVASLEDVLAARALALSRLRANGIAGGTPYSELEDVLVPVFYLHRYQTEAAIKLIGGVRYGYTVKAAGDNAPDVGPVSAGAQRRALDVVIQTLGVRTLTTPADLLALMPPKPPGYERDRENAPSHTLPLYDPVTAAEAAAEETLRLLFQPARLARLRQQHAADPALPGTSDVFSALVEACVDTPRGGGLEGEIHDRVALLVIEHLLLTGYGDDQVPEVAADAQGALVNLGEQLRRGKTVHRAYLERMIDRAAEKGVFQRRDDVARIPPGSPI
jgi:hypothetical protein